MQLADIPLPSISFTTLFWTASGLAALLAISEKLFKVSGWFREQLVKRTLKSRLAGQVFTHHDISRHTQYYIEQDLQKSDPSEADEPVKSEADRTSAFAELDRLLFAHGQNRFVIILGDSGMGKTALLLNYAARHWRSRRRRNQFDLFVVPLAFAKADELLAGVSYSDRKNTVLFLDALDEDKQAIESHAARIADLLTKTAGFMAVVITARTQFFARHEEIPDDTDVVVIGPTGAGETKEHRFRRLYLAPFTDVQVERYLRSRFRVWALAKRQRSREVIGRVRDMAARPMVLAHVEDLIGREGTISTSSEVYDIIVDRWLHREAPYVKDPQALADFSSLLAAKLMAGKKRDNVDRLPLSELKALVDPAGFRLEEWQVRQRSLLNRDALNNFKFAHRSIMEHLYAREIMGARVDTSQALWSSMVSRFVTERLNGGAPYPFDFGGAVLDTSVLPSALEASRLASVDVRGLTIRGRPGDWRAKPWANQSFVDPQEAHDLAGAVALTLIDWSDRSGQTPFRWMWFAVRHLFTDRFGSMSEGALMVKIRKSIADNGTALSFQQPCRDVRMMSTLGKLKAARPRSIHQIEPRRLSHEALLCGAVCAVMEDGMLTSLTSVGAFFADVAPRVFARYEGDNRLVYQDASPIERMLWKSKTDFDLPH